MNAGPVAREWADWAWSLRAGTTRIPADVLAGSTIRTFDLLGCAIAGLRTPELRAIADAYAQPSLAGGRAVALVDDERSVRMDAMDAAVVVASAAHCLDYDDTHFPSLTHPSAAVFGAALAAAQVWGCSSADLVVAITIGRELAIRIGLAFGGALGDRGLNTSTIAGAVAAAAAVAFLRPDSSPPLIEGALSLAAGLAGGTQEWAATGADNKWLQFGFAAATGYRAALTAVPSVRLAPAALEGSSGLLETLSPGAHDARELTRHLGDEWLGDEIVLKPYPYPNGSHTIFDAIDHDERLRYVDLAEIDSVELEVSGYTERLMCVPWESKRRPTSEYGLRFSLPGLVALALANRARGGGPFARVGARVADLARTGDLVDRITYRRYRDAAGAAPLIGVPGTVHVQLRSGTRITATAERRGEGGLWGTRLTADEVVAKFARNVTPDDPLPSPLPAWQADTALDVLTGVTSRRGVVDFSRVAVDFSRVATGSA